MQRQTVVALSLRPSYTLPKKWKYKQESKNCVNPFKRSQKGEQSVHFRLTYRIFVLREAADRSGGGYRDF